jgi:uncharacterized membrane protein
MSELTVSAGHDRVASGALVGNRRLVLASATVATGLIAGLYYGFANPHAVRNDFETTWVIWNVVRAPASGAAFAVLCRALLVHTRQKRA